MRLKEYKDIKDSLDIMRNICVSKHKEVICESTDNDTSAIPYTQEDEIFTNIKDVCKTQFGADFNGFKTPMLFYPNDGDITLSGQISSLNNAKFQFRYKDASNGCYIWFSPLQLTDETLKKLQIIMGVYKNWRKELETSEDVTPMSYKSNEDKQNTLQPGDDAELA